MIELLTALITTHITILCVTIYLHRCQAHRALTLHPAVSHFMRAWLWLTTGMVTREWVAVHRKHHQACEQPGDPHSPHVYGIWRVLFGGAMLYEDACQNSRMVQQFGVGTPDDWIEQNLYSRFSWLGIFLLLATEMWIFGTNGFLIWAVQMIWIPFWAAGVINGLGHWIGYRNNDTRDHSHNLVPWGILIGGEELHNNHHHAPASARLSIQPWEFDIGWMWICILQRLGLARVRRFSETS